MKNDSTQLNSEKLFGTTVNATSVKASPRQTTIALLKQFARAYTCAASVPVALGGFVAN